MIMRAYCAMPRRGGGHCARERCSRAAAAAVIYGGARSNWLTTKEFKRINAKFDVLRGGATRCWSEIPAPFVNQPISYASMHFFFDNIFNIKTRPVSDGFFSDHFSSTRSQQATPHPPPTPLNRDASARYNIGIGI